MSHSWCIAVYAAVNDCLLEIFVEMLFALNDPHYPQQQTFLGSVLPLYTAMLVSACRLDKS